MHQRVSIKLQKEAKSVNSKQLDLKIKVTVALTVTEDGEKLKPFMKFTRKRTTCLTYFNNIKNYRGLYPQTDIHCTCSPKAGMSSKVMLEWINTIWEPFVATQSSHTYFFLDC